MQKFFFDYIEELFAGDGWRQLFSNSFGEFVFAASPEGWLHLGVASQKRRSLRPAVQVSEK